MKTTVKVADDYYLNAANVCTCSLTLSCTTNSTSTTSGALVVGGGMAIACNVCIGGSLNATGNITAEGNVTIGDADTDQVTFGADIHSHIIPNESACYNLGSATQKWNCGWIDNMNMCTVDLTSTTNSTSTTTGALVVCGGVGVACDVWLGGDTVVEGTTNSTNPITGALIVGGGVGVLCDMVVCGDLTVCGSQSSGSSDTNLHATGTTNATTTTSGSLQSSGGIGIVCDAYIGGCVTATCFIGDGSQLTNVSGGGGGSGYWTCTANNLSYATGIVCVTNTTNSTSATTGALQSTGGLGVVCDAWFGGEITVPTLCVTTCFVSAGTSTTTITSGSNIELDATNRVLITDTPFRLASFTTTTRNALTPANGDLIYNTTDNKVQAYANGAWADLH